MIVFFSTFSLLTLKKAVIKKSFKTSVAVAFLFVFTIGFNRNAVKATDFVQQVSPVLTDTGAPVAMVVFKAMAKGYYLRK